MSTAPTAEEPLLVVQDLHVEFSTYGGIVQAVRGVDFSVARGKTLAIVGESGCGKSVTVQSIMGLIPTPPGRITSGSARLGGVELLGLPSAEANMYRGVELGMIFQDPMTSLNPTMTIGNQIAETLMVHRGHSHAAALKAAEILLDKTKIPEAKRRARQYPFEFSGGMLQRAMIAQSLACSPSILIADEPTTALDVTIQAQILNLMKSLRDEKGTAILLITHDLGVIAEMCDEVTVMYAGMVVERAPIREIFSNPLHAYTRGLIACTPSLESERGSILPAKPGQVANPSDFVSGCRFCQRMEREGQTLLNRPEFVEASEGHWVESCPICLDESQDRWE